jgi:hypothetical protein
MIKLKLLWSLIKSNWKIPIYLVMAFIAFKFYWNEREAKQAAQRREGNLKSVIFKATKGLRTQAKVNKKLEGVYLLEQKTSAHWKEIALKGSGTQTQIDSNRTKVAFDTITDCISLEGFTLTNPPYWEIPTLELTPFWINVKVMDFENKVYSWTTSSSCVYIDSVNVEVSPDLKGACRDGFDKGEFFLGTGIAGTLFLLFNIFNN